MADSNNLLIRLHRWVNRQDENFTTEVLVHLMQHLLDHESETAVRFLDWLTGGVMNLRPIGVKAVSLKTQVTISTGRLDIEIKTNKHLIYLEAKVGSGLGPLQLERYREDLDSRGLGKKTALILLTRDPIGSDVLGGKPEKCLRWHEIADWLEMERRGICLKEAESHALFKQFIKFLSARGMTMEHVGWEMISGVKAMRHFLALLKEATRVSGILVKANKWPDCAGFHLGDKHYWLGFYYTTPGTLHLNTNQVRIDRDKAVNVGYGRVWESKWVPGGWSWGHQLELESEEVHFFARSRPSQMQCLENFIREFLDAVSQIKSTGQAELSANEAAGDDEDEVTDLENEQCPQ